jgi:ABC-2 type transport system permease protein
MTLQKSLNKTFRYTFVSAIKSFFYIPLIGLGALTFIVPFLVYDQLKPLEESYKSQSTPGNVLKLSDFYKYYLLGGDDVGGVYTDLVIRIGIVILSVILAVMMFRFITSKKTVNVYFSLGITRKSLFISNFLAGTLMLFAVILIPFIIAAFINVSFSGSGKELWLAASYYIFNYFVLALASFGVSAAVVSAVGTVPEGIAYSAVVIAFTSILFTCLETLMDIFVWGSPYSKYNYLGASLNQKYQVLNPVLFGRSSAVSLGELHREDVNSKFEWIAPDFKVVIIWLIVAVAVFFFAMYLFQKRKAEISGFTGKSRILNNIVIFAIGFSLFCLSLGIASNFAQGNKIVIYGALIGAAVFLLVYGVLTLILTRSFKQMLSEMKILGLHYGILAVITIVFAFGLFGYASRIPDIKDIKSVSITGIVPDAVVDAGKNGLSGEDINFIYVNMYGTDNNIVFSTEKDLKIITDLHKSVISDGKLVIDSNRDLPWDKQVLGADLKIVYTLKNGKTIERFYSAIKASTINKFLSLENTDSYRSLIKSVLTEPVKANDSEALKSAKEFFQGESSEFSIIPYDLSNESVLKLGSSMKKELLNALSEDLSAMTSEQRFRPESDALGSMIVNGLYSFGDE